MNRKAKALEFVDAGYSIQVTGRHLEVTDAMKDYAMEKISKIERFMNRIIDVNVIMDIQRWEHRIEIRLSAGNIKIVSQASTPDMYSSIDKAVDKLEAQILRYKSKIQDYHARDRIEKDMTVNIISPQEIEEDLGLEEPLDNQEVNRFKPHRVVKEEKHLLKTLTYDEAVMKMELSDDTFLVFKNEADQKIKVIYRREDENYGVIDPTC